MKHDDTVLPPDEDAQRDPQAPTSSSPSFPPFSPDALEEEAVYFAAESATDAFLSEVEHHTTHNTIPVLKSSESQVSDWLQTLASRAGDMLSCIRREESGSYSVLYISEALTHILGYTPGEFLFLTDEQYIHPSDLNYTRAALQRCLERPDQREVLEYRARHKDQSWRHLESFAITVQLEDGQDGLLMTTRDVTESRERENQLLNRVAWFAALSNQITDVLRVVDRSGHVLVANGRLNWLFGDTSQAIDVETVLSHTHPEDQKQVEEALTHTLDAPGERIRMGFRARTPEGEWRYIEIELFNRQDDTIIQGIILIGRDLTARKLFDSTTRLPSRTLFLDRVERLLIRDEQAADEQFAVLVVDVNQYGKVTDGLGNAAGERLLRTIGTRIMVSIRPSDFVGRLGREKFMVLLHGMRTPADIARICQRIHESVEQPCFIEGHKVFTTVTIGSAFSTSPFHTADQMVQAAETAMHRGKQHGGGSGVTEMFDPTMGQEVRERLKLEGSLRLALERNELLVYFQPIVSLASRKLAGFEALCRWKREDGFVSPGEFIPLAEETGLINNLGHWVLTHACESVAEWQRMTRQRPFVSINLSGKQLANGTIVEDVKSLIKRLKIPPAQIKLEVTETALITNTDLVARTLHDLRDLGVRLALDDFGTGYSSLNYLHRFPFHTIKIDKSFVDMLGKDKESAAIIPTIIQLARSLNMEVIAEGVETEEQAKQLQHMGCPYGQGYLFARALPKHQLPELFKRNKISAN